MREVVGVAPRRLEGPRRCTTQPPQSAGLSDFKPGYLDLSPDALARLVCNDPIDQHYIVEKEPFATGKYATVRRCRHRVSGLELAAKYLKKRRRSQELRYEILHEVAVLEACTPCGQIINLYQVFETSTEMILLLELAPGGDLQAVIDKDEVMDESTARRLMRQILEGVEYLHAYNVAHLDIKPQNVVLTGDYPDCDVKLCDFGISRYVGHEDDIREILGTPDYVAPEVLNYESISLATDMWSVGVLVYVLLTGCSPFGGDTKQDTFCNISRGHLDFPDDLFESVSEPAKDLMRRLMVKDPRARLTAIECLNHEWFQCHDDDCEMSSNLQAKEFITVSRQPSIRVSQQETDQKEVLLRTFRSMVGHEKNINRATALVRTPSLRRPPADNPEPRRAHACKTLPVHVFAIKKALENAQAQPKPNLLPQTVFESSPEPFAAFTGKCAPSTNPLIELIHPAFRRSADSSAILSDTTIPTQVYLPRHSLPLPVFIPSTTTSLPPAFPPPLRPVFIDTTPAPPSPDAPPRAEDMPSVTSSETSSITSDSISEMSVDSSGDCSSFISSDDQSDWEQPRWVKECTGSLQRALSRFNIVPSAPLTRRSFSTSTPNLFVPDNRKFGLTLLKEDNGNEVVIREVKAGRVSRFSEVKCESVRSRINKLQRTVRS